MSYSFTGTFFFGLMEVGLIRTGSASVHVSSAHGSPKISTSDHKSITGILFPGKNNTSSGRCSIHLEIRDKKDVPRRIRRALSITDMFRSVFKVSSRFSVIGSRSFSEDDGLGSVILKRKVLDGDNNDRVARNRQEELEFCSGGIGKGRNIGGGGGACGNNISGDDADQSKIGAYYQEMLKANPGNPLLLRNYGKFLHEVERDMVRAEEYYERAILASPGDGEVLSLYGKLIWEKERDEGRAQAYFDQAVEASPDDCFVLGSYAHFLWDAEDDDDEEAAAQVKTTLSSMVEAF